MTMKLCASLFPVKLADGEATLETTHAWAFDESTLQLSRLPLDGAIDAGGYIKLVFGGKMIPAYDCRLTEEAAVKYVAGRLMNLEDWHQRRGKQLDECRRAIDAMNRQPLAATA